MKQFYHAVLTIRQLTIVLKQRYLFLSIIFLIISSNNKPLSAADNFSENITITSTDNHLDYMNSLEEKIQNLLSNGHHPKEIVAMLSDSQNSFHKNQELIANLLNEINSINKDVTIVMNNKESETYYAQMNSLIKMKKRILILKIIIVTGIAAGLFYLLYQLLKKDPNTDEDIEEIDAIDELISQESADNGHEIISTTLPQDTIDNRLEVITDANYRVILTNTWQAELLTELREEVIQQIEHARNIGLEPAAVLPTYRPITNNPIFTMRITEQLAHAANIGLTGPSIPLGDNRQAFRVPMGHGNSWILYNMEFIDRQLEDFFN